MSMSLNQRCWLTKFLEPRVDWSMLQTFLDVVECGSFRNAAIERIAALNTVRRRIDEFERITGRRLLDREQSGVVATPDGESVLAVVRAMSSARDAAVRGLIDDW